MAYTQSSNKATQKYQKKVYDTFLLRVYKGKKEKIQDFAEKNGESLNGFICRLISDEMGEDINKK